MNLYGCETPTDTPSLLQENTLPRIMCDKVQTEAKLAFRWSSCSSSSSVFNPITSDQTAGQGLQCSSLFPSVGRLTAHQTKRCVVEEAQEGSLNSTHEIICGRGAEMKAVSREPWSEQSGFSSVLQGNKEAIAPKNTRHWNRSNSQLLFGLK